MLLATPQSESSESAQISLFSVRVQNLRGEGRLELTGVARAPFAYWLCWAILHPSIAIIASNVVHERVERRSAGVSPDPAGPELGQARGLAIFEQRAGSAPTQETVPAISRRDCTNRSALKQGARSSVAASSPTLPTDLTRFASERTSHVTNGGSAQLRPGPDIASAITSPPASVGPTTDKSLPVPLATVAPARLFCPAGDDSTTSTTTGCRDSTGALQHTTCELPARKRHFG